MYFLYYRCVFLRNKSETYTSGHRICVLLSIMKKIVQTTKLVRSTIVDWVLIKGPELFVTIYGK